MCGIAGLILAPARPITRKELCSLAKHLDHRGPDDFGWLSLQGSRVRLGRRIVETCLSDTVLLHHRLSILDLTDCRMATNGYA